MLQGVSGDFDPSGKKHCCADVVATSWSRSKRKDACTARRRPVVRNGMPLRGDGVCGVCGVRMVGVQKRQWWCICRAIGRLRGVMQTAVVMVMAMVGDSGEETARPRPTEQQQQRAISMSFKESAVGLCRRRQQGSRHVERRTDVRALAL